MRIEVVLDDGDAHLARGLNRLPYLLNLLIASGPPVYGVGKAADHQVAERNAARLEFVYPRLKLADAPRQCGAAAEGVIDSDLDQTANGLLSGAIAQIDRQGNVRRASSE